LLHDDDLIEHPVIMKTGQLHYMLKQVFGNANNMFKHALITW